MHMQLGDTRYATKLAYDELIKNNSSENLWKVYHKALCKDLQTKEAIQTFFIYQERFPEEELNKEMIEELSWAVIQKGHTSTAPLTRLIASIAALLSQDTKGVLLIHERLGDQNAIIRKVAATISGYLPDHTIHKKMFLRLQKEKDVEVKMALIQSLAKAQYRPLLPYLLHQLESDKGTSEELAVKVQAISNLTEKISDTQIAKLSRSQKAGLRILACELTRQFESEKSLPYILPLTNDKQAAVRASAIHTVGLLKPRKVTRPRDYIPSVAITAAWADTVYSPDEGIKLFTPWITHRERKIRLEAAAALSQTGPGGISAMRHWIYKTNDPYIKATLAIGLIGEREEIAVASNAIQKILSQQGERLRIQSYEVGSAIIPSSLEGQSTLLNMSEVVNQVTRLKLINLLSAVDSTGVKEIIEKFLQKRSSSVTNVALTMLLSQGEELSIECIRGFLKHENVDVRIQAAILIGAWLQDEEAIHVLHSEMKAAKRERKQQIIEGLGRIGSKKSLPFLAEAMKDPYPSTQIITASSILQCLYH